MVKRVYTCVDFMRVELAASSFYAGEGNMQNFVSPRFYPSAKLRPQRGLNVFVSFKNKGLTLRDSSWLY